MAPVNEALDKVALKFRREGAEVEILGMNEASATIVGKLAVRDKSGASLDLGGHWPPPQKRNLPAPT